jgi:membrane-bound lytic murein transglycosylase F
MIKKILIITFVMIATIYYGSLNHHKSKLLSPRGSLTQKSASTSGVTRLNVSIEAGHDNKGYAKKMLWTPEWDSQVVVPQVVISQYDPIMREVAADKGYDWRLIAAIANTESRFDHDIVSNAGAVGLMQIMPVVARQFKVDPQQITDPHTNVMLGVELLDHIGGTFRFPAKMSERDRLSIILASYNSGMGHVLDARRLAVKHGENPNSWGVVAKYLKLKCDPVYYEDEVVKCGAFYDNRQTLGFVRKVMRNYDSYCLLTI